MNEEFKMTLELVRNYKVKEEFIAEELELSLSTVRQNLKIKASPSNSFQTKLTKLISASINSGYKFFRLEHNRNTQAINLNIYNDNLPAVPLCKLMAPPRIYGTKQVAEKVPQVDAPVDWDQWRSDLWARIAKHITNRRENSENNLGSHVTVISGLPGSGKSTMMARLLNSAYNDKIRGGEYISDIILPIFLPLEIYSHSNDFEDFISAAEFYYKHSWPLKEIEIEVFLRRNKKQIVFLLDGFDEAPLSCRNKIIEQVYAREYPVILTSRYTKPDPSEGGIHNFYLGYLKRDDILEYINMVTENITGSQDKINNYKDELNSLKLEIEKKLINPNHEFFSHTRKGHIDNSIETPVKSFDYKEAIDERKREFTLEELKIVSSPILLNLLIASWLDKTARSESIPDILSRYVEFLIGKWRMARRSIGTSDNNLLSSEDLHQSLGLVAFMAMTYEHCLGTRITIDEVKKLLNEYLFTQRHDKDRLVNEVVAESTSAALLKIEEDQSCQFAHPHEYLKTLYGSMFIEYSENICNSRNFGRLEKRIIETHPSTFATYQKFLSNPNLRYIEESIVFYLVKQSTEARVPEWTLLDLFEAALETAPIAEKYCGMDADSVNKIAPLNIVLLGRVFSGNRKLQEKLPDITRIISKKVRDLYLNTEIEFVYQALHNIYDGLPSEPDTTYFNDDNALYKEQEHKWRIARTCDDLHDVIKESEHIQTEKLRDMIKRRVVYKYRYHADTFSKRDWGFLGSYLDNYKRDGDIVSQSRRLLVFNTLRMISDNIEKSNENSEFLDDLDNTIGMFEKRLREYRSEAIKRMEQVKGKAFIDPDKYIDSFYQIRFSTKKVFPRLFINDLNPVGVQKLQIENFVSILSGRLYKAQKEEKECRTDNEKKLNIEKQGSLVLLLTYIADSFYGQQFIMPKEFSISNITNEEDCSDSYDPGKVLKLLFDGARDGIIPDNTISSTETLNKLSRDVGGWQLYDIYVQAIWRILHYLPSNAHYEYLY